MIFLREPILGPSNTKSMRLSTAERFSAGNSAELSEFSNMDVNTIIFDEVACDY